MGVDAQLVGAAQVAFGALVDDPFGVVPTDVGVRAIPIRAGETVTFSIEATGTDCVGLVPPDAVAVALNITAINATDRTFVTVWDEGPVPNVSSLNPATVWTDKTARPAVPMVKTVQMVRLGSMVRTVLMVRLGSMVRTVPTAWMDKTVRQVPMATICSSGRWWSTAVVRQLRTERRTSRPSVQ